MVKKIRNMNIEETELVIRYGIINSWTTDFATDIQVQDMT